LKKWGTFLQVNSRIEAVIDPKERTNMDARLRPSGMTAFSVIPAQAGIQFRRLEEWMPD
jgi:hypothetical protein